MGVMVNRPWNCQGSEKKVPALPERIDENENGWLRDPGLCGVNIQGWNIRRIGTKSTLIDGNEWTRKETVNTLMSSNELTIT